MDAELMDVGRTNTEIARPTEAAPSRRASEEERARWSERYVAWFIAQTPQDGPLPKDIPPTHRYEIEFTYCMLDPQRYELETQAELRRPSMNITSIH